MAILPALDLPFFFFFVFFERSQAAVLQLNTEQEAEVPPSRPTDPSPEGRLV